MQHPANPAAHRPIAMPTSRRDAATLPRMHPRTTVHALLAALAAVLAVLGGCSYEIKGRVIESSSESLGIIASDDPRLDEGTPVKGARVIVTQNPNGLNRRDVASAVSDGNGWFTLKIGDTGAGFTEELWAIRVARTGFGGVEDVVELPFSPSRSRVFATIVPGPSRRPAERSAGSSVQGDIDRFSSSPTGRAP